ncbi:MAG: sugar phosphate isomerase/epimerase family protein [Phycisphaerales bacterium]
MNNPTPRLGVCSWSLRPTGPEDLADKVLSCGLSAVQIALDPIRERLWDEARTREILRESRIEIVSGMMCMAGEDYSTLETIHRTGGVRMEATWAGNLEAARANSEVARRLGLRLVTFHAGFIPNERAHPERGTILSRVRQVVDAFLARGCAIALETGQETAETLEVFLRDAARPGLGVNFDPANMILYGMGDPIEALRRLSGVVRQVHIKDAVPTRVQGTWGLEKAVGQGAVDWRVFLATLRETGQAANLMIEREDGDDRLRDVRAAVAYLRELGVEAR